MAVQITQARACQNHLLSKLPDEQLHLLLPHLDWIQSKLKDVLYRQDDSLDYVYFPCNGAYSCIIDMEDGSGVEVGTIGNESFTGVELLLGAEKAVETVICQIPGNSLRMRVDDFRHAVDTNRRLCRMLQCSAQGYLAQVSQSVACNRLHSVEMRFARWLLLTHDRVQGDDMPLTQEFTAAMLGVHRPSVSLVAGVFQQAGIIKYSRGRLSILDRARLEEASCECYAIVRKKFERLLPIPRG